MKRDRGDLSSFPKASVDLPDKVQRRHKDSATKAAALRSRQLAASPEKLTLPRGGRVEEEYRPGASSSQETRALLVDEVTAGWDSSWVQELEGWWWWWGVEEDKLSGWFPFEEEDFIGGGVRGGGGVFWEEEDHDIWQLQQIHEIPTSAK